MSIVNGNTRNDNFVPNRNTFPKLPDIGSLPPVNRGGDGGFYFSTSTSKSVENFTNASTQNKTYFEDTTTKQSATSITTEATKIPIATETIPLIESPTILPIFIAVSTIFLVAGIIAVIIFRKQICRNFPFGRKFKKTKIDKSKKSNQSINVITLSDESSRNSMVMQHWQGPQSIGNRYTPWASNVPLDGSYSNSSFSYSGGNIKVPGYDRWEFPRHRLKVFNILGEGKYSSSRSFLKFSFFECNLGAFGQVWRCEANDIDGVDGISTVAVKTLKENAVESEKKDLASELQVMKSLEPHVRYIKVF